MFTSVGFNEQANLKMKSLLLKSYRYMLQYHLSALLELHTSIGLNHSDIPQHLGTRVQLLNSDVAVETVDFKSRSIDVGTVVERETVR